MAEHNEIGKKGEQLACDYLKAHGYQILHSNWHWHHYELDIVARQGKELVVVEVKTRAANYLMAPEYAVDQGKIRRIVAAADAYVRRYNIDLSVRFDLMLLIHKEGKYSIEHVEDAFYAPC